MTKHPMHLLRWQIKTWFKRWRGGFPLVRRSHVQEIIYRRIREVEQRYEAKLLEQQKPIAAIVERSSRIGWTRSRRHNRYVMQIEFCPEMYGSNYCTSRELEYLAEAFGHRVANEIRSTRFIQEATVIE